jgi:hypothetical protein
MWMLEAWVAVTVAGGAQVAAWRPRPWLPGYLFGSHFFIVDGCGYLFREGFWEILGIFLGGCVNTYAPKMGEPSHMRGGVYCQPPACPAWIWFSLRKPAFMGVPSD